MAIYRNIQMSFWTDTKIMDDFSVSEKFFYLYLLTNPHTNLCGCYEISFRQIAYETGLERKRIQSLIERLQNQHEVVRFNESTKEVLLLHWSKYNWTSSEKFRKPLAKEIESVKTVDFKAFLEDLYNGSDTVSIPYKYGSDTTVTVTVTDTVTDTVHNKATDKDLIKEFESIWKLYPKKQGKERAKKAYLAARKSGTEEADVRKGVNSYVTYIKANGLSEKYIKHGSTFFNQQSWQDDFSVNSKFNNADGREYNMSDLELKLLATN